MIVYSKFPDYDGNFNASRDMLNMRGGGEGNSLVKVDRNVWALAIPGVNFCPGIRF